MLQRLSIRDFILVDSLDIDFQAGLTVLTGETGAGKSILVDALSLVLGDRAESGVVRPGAKRAEISAEFGLEGLAEVETWLLENGLEGDPGQCLLRRVMEAEGRSRAFINGSQVTLTQLRELGERLVDIHGQHAHHALLKPPVQRQLLDEFAGAQTEALATSQTWHDWQAAKKRLQVAREEAGARLLEKEGLEAALAEVGPLLEDLRAWDDMQAEHQRQAHMSSLIESGAEVLAGLEEEDGLLRRLGRLHSLLRDMLEKDTSLADEQSLLDAALSNLEEARHGMRRYADRLSLDPERLAELDRRIAEIHRVSRKHRLSTVELLERHSIWLARLDELAAEQDIEALEAEVDRVESAYLANARKLSGKRRQGAAALGETVTQTMTELALGEGRFEALLTPCQPQSYGMEEIAFLAASHASLSPGPLDKVASGGELSRISLAIQTALSGQAGVPTLIFDEVDVGIGGGVAEAVGRRLARLGETRQVLVVTHLPQVAAHGRQHLRVSKIAGADWVISQVVSLDEEERVLEIARMLGGQEITETTRKHAGEMLNGACGEKPAKGRKKTA